MKNLSITILSIFTLFLSGFAGDTEKKAEESSQWEQIKEEAEEHMAAVIALSKEKWSEFQAFSQEEWKESSKKSGSDQKGSIAT
jgi:Flp pilus assembly protein TadB